MAEVLSDNFGCEGGKGALLRPGEDGATKGGDGTAPSPLLLVCCCCCLGGWRGETPSVTSDSEDLG